MSTISVDQRFALLAKLGENIDWDSLTTAQVQLGILDAKRAGAEATAFVLNGFRVQMIDFFRETGEFTVTIPALARPALAQLQEFGIKKIERDISPTKAVTLKLGTVLRPDEERINGAEYERRIAPMLDTCLGYQQAAWLVEHQDESPEFTALLGKVYIDFPGLVVADADGHRHFPYLVRRGKRWFLSWGWVGYALDRGGRVAVSGK